MAKATKTANKSASLDDLFGEVDKVTEVKQPAASAKKDKHLEMTIPENLQAAFVKLVRYKAVYDRVEGCFENQKDDTENGLITAWCEFVTANKSRPEHNPKVTCQYGEITYSGLFQVHARYTKINPTIGENQAPEDVIVDMMTNLGIPEDIAIEIVKNELNCSPARGINSFDNVMKTEGGPEALKRLMAYAMANAEGKDSLVHVEPLTAADRKLLFYRTARVEVKDGFLDRLPLYVKTPEQLRAVFTVIKPVYYPSHMKIKCPGGLKQEYELLSNIAGEMLNFVPKKGSKKDEDDD